MAPPLETRLENDFMETRLIPFLIRAKQATYAGKGAETAPSRPNSHDLVYGDGDLLYYDTYLGTEKFAGEEAIWAAGRPCWSMNYAGRITGAPFSFDFLREALSRVPPDAPYRGPAHYADGEYAYRCQVTGHFGWFRGKETIFFNGKEIYECCFHGGWIE